MPSQAKIEWVEELTETIKQSPDMVFADFKGLTVEEMESLRRDLYERGSRFQVVKNRLAQRAFSNAFAGPSDSNHAEETVSGSELPDEGESPDVDNLPGVGPAKVDALAEEGFATIASIAGADRNQLTEVSGIGDAMAEQISNAARDAVETSDTSEVDPNGHSGTSVESDTFDEIDEFLTGNTGVAFAGEGLVNTAKVLVEFAEEHEQLAIKGGLLEGSILDEDGVEQISKLPTREELLTKLATSLNSPIQALATFLNYPMQSLVNSLEQIKDQKED